MNFYDEDDMIDAILSEMPTWDDDENAHDGKCTCPRCIAMEMDY